MSAPDPDAREAMTPEGRDLVHRVEKTERVVITIDGGAR